MILNLDLQFFIHYGLHLFLPGIAAFAFYKSRFKLTWIIMLLAMLIDLDHLLASPVFDPNRCSIGFHLLHSYYAIALYIVLLMSRRTRIIAIGLLLHILVDYTDCLLMKIL
jgi:hypothetical protein